MSSEHGEDALPREAEATASPPPSSPPRAVAPRPRALAPARHRPGSTILLGALGAAVVVAGVLAYALAPPAVAPSESPERLAPLRAVRDPRTGEPTAPFSGFAVSVDTVPEDAVVFVDGVERGEAPVFAGVSCAPGAKVEVRAERRGFAPARTTTTCRADALVKLELRLVRR